MDIRVSLDKGAYMPVREHDTDAGADLKCREDFVIYEGSSTVIDTGVHIEIPHGMCGLIVSKSGLYVKEGIRTTGLIDEGYSGSIVVKLWNDSGMPHYFKAGCKIAQIVFLPVAYYGFEQCEEIQGGQRGNNGFGSTGR